MDIHQMLADLRSESERLSEAILTIERLAAGGKPRRGRPPKWMAAIRTPVPSSSTNKPRRKFSAATRQNMAAAQKKRWAAKKGTV